MSENANIKEFDLNDAVSRVAEKTGLEKKHVKNIITEFLTQTAVGLAEHGRIEYHNFFSITLKIRNPRSGNLKGKAWSTPRRLEPEFQAAKPLRDLVQEKQGLECL